MSIPRSASPLPDNAGCNPTIEEAQKIYVIRVNTWMDRDFAHAEVTYNLHQMPQRRQDGKLACATNGERETEQKEEAVLLLS